MQPLSGQINKATGFNYMPPPSSPAPSADLLAQINKATGYTPNMGVTGGPVYQQQANEQAAAQQQADQQAAAQRVADQQAQQAAQQQSQQQAAAKAAADAAAAKQAAFNAQMIGQYQDQLNNLPTFQNAQNTTADKNYNAALQQLLGQRNLGQQSYDASKQNSATGYVNAKNTIGAQAGSTLNGLLRLIGSRGGSGGISDVLRQAVARGASVQRNDVGTTFGQNQQGLDQNWGQYLQGYNDQTGNLGIQRQQNREALANQVDQTRAGLNESIAGLQSTPADAQPYLNSADSILAKLAGYVAPSYNYSTTPYQAPTAASYTTTPPPTAGYNSQATNDYSSPFLQTLLGKKQPLGA